MPWILIKDLLGHNDVLGKFSWLLWWWAILPLDPSWMISWHQAQNARPGWLTLLIEFPTHISTSRPTRSFSRVNVTFVLTFSSSSSHLKFHLFFTVASISVTAVFLPCDNFRNIFTLCVDYQCKMAQKKKKEKRKWHTFQWHPYYFPCFTVSVNHSHSACCYSRSTQAKRKLPIWSWTVQEQDRKQSSACEIGPWKPLTYYIYPQIFLTDLHWSQKWSLGPLNWWKSANWRKSPIYVLWMWSDESSPSCNIVCFSNVCMVFRFILNVKICLLILFCLFLFYVT